MSAFELVTGYMVIATAELVTTYAINWDALLLEVPLNLPDDHLISVLNAAQKKIGSAYAYRCLAAKLGQRLAINIDHGAA